MNWYLQQAKAIDPSLYQQAQQRQTQLTKPLGALGRVEDIAIQFSAWQNTVKPSLEHIAIMVMAADHGVADEGVSAYPQAVTVEMIKNIARGGAAISVLARQLNADMQVINLGSINPVEAMDQVVDKRLAAGSANICKQAAMSQEQLEQALKVGQDLALAAKQAGKQLIIGGEMGIANTTPAACIVARLLHISAAQASGPGTGLDQQQLEHKIHVVERALALHTSEQALEVLRCLGGFEIAGLVGLFIGAAQQGIPVLLDGYIVTAAALIASRINPSVKAWFMASHQSAEPAHPLMLQALGLDPLLKLSMRLGEGSGAAICVPIIQSACKLQSEMASFAEAGVSNKD